MPMRQSEEKTMVKMENISASQHMMKNGQPPQRVLACIWLRIKSGQVWGIYAPMLYEASLLLEIMANVRAFEDGRCVLVERGMMRRKRMILPHVFYIGSTDMLYDNMNVLEYLMFATAKTKMEPVVRQEMLFEWLIETGLGDISLTPTRWLDPEEKAAVVLMAAACSQSSIVIVNLPTLHYDSRMSKAIARTASRIKEQGKALIINTKDAELIENACTHVAYLAKGRILCQGSVDYLKRHFDPYDVVIEAEAELEKKLHSMMPSYGMRRKDDGLYIRGARAQKPADIFREIIDSGLVPEKMYVNRKTVKNALEELAIRHDLS